MIGVFTLEQTNRLKYVLDFCFKEKGEEYKLINTEAEWNSFDGVKLNYSNLSVDCDYEIEPSGLLSETDIDKYLKLEKPSAKLTLRGDADMLSVIFYIISRYEEYQGYNRDSHGRFTSDQSHQSLHGVLKEPICDHIVHKLWRKLGLNYEQVLDRFEFVPSFDIDVAWAYKNRPLWRKLGAFKYGRIGERIAVLFGLKKDPYDTYSKIVEISAKLNRIICFAPVGDYGKMDKNISHKNENYRSLLRGLNSDGGMGLHPSYASYMDVDKIQEEKERIEEILGHKMEKSRFHFLRLDIPESYRLMIELGFKKDYSMGYADSPGFRAGTSFPFYFFDLETNEKKDYLIFPFAYLDNSYKDYVKIDIDEAIEDAADLMNQVKSVGGLFMCVWHNHSISDKGEWKGWYELLKKTVEWGKPE